MQGWKVEYLVLEDYQPMERAHEEVVGKFNDPYGEVLVLLLNTKAVNPLLNLSEVNKLIIMDTQWDVHKDGQLIRTL